MTANIEIAPVDTSKAVLFFNSNETDGGQSSIYIESTYLEADKIVVRVKSKTSTSGAFKFSGDWQVIEFY